MIKIGKFWFPDQESHFQEQFYLDEYQIQQRKTALSHCDNFRTALDIGAHVGTWTQDLQFYFKRVIAFEPHPKHAECLKKNIDRERVDIIQLALGSTRDDIRVDYNDKSNTGTAAISETGTAAIIVPLDSIQLTNDIDLIKIDVEGYELEVLKGATETLINNHPVLNIEINENSRNLGYGKPEIDSYLKPFGYQYITKVNNDYIYK